MIKSNSHLENNCHSALQDFMKNVLQLQNHSELCVIDDNVKKSPPPKKKNVPEVKSRRPEQDQSNKRESKNKIASKQRFSTIGDRSSDRPLPSSVIGGHVAMLRQNSLDRHFLGNDRPLPSSVIDGHVAMLRQESLERHFLTVADDDEEEETAGACMPTVPEDTSFNEKIDAVVVGSTTTNTPKRKKQRRQQQQHKTKLSSKRDQESSSKHHHQTKKENDDTKTPSRNMSRCLVGSKSWKSDLKDKLEKNRKGGKTRNKKQSQPTYSTEWVYDGHDRINRDNHKNNE